MFKQLQQKALATIRANLVDTEYGPLLAAGGNQFRTFWTRDFCFSVSGLLEEGYADLVLRQLEVIFKFKSSQNVLPRGLDQIPPQYRVVWNTFFRGRPVPFLTKKALLKPEYLGEHGTPAFDSNLLFIQAACLWALHQQKPLFLSPLEIQDLLSFYQPFTHDGLLQQPPFSDWQDSARREGAVLHTQLLYFDTLQLLTHFDGFDFFKPALQRSQTILSQWPRSKEGLFHEGPSTTQISLDSHCRLLGASSLLSKMERAELYLVLKESALWQSGSLPGQPVFPDHPNDQISWTCRSVGLRHYHDRFYWGWLMAEAARVAYLFEDPVEGDRILGLLEEATSGSFLSEIFEFKNSKLTPVKRGLYESENPFSWTASKCLEALAQRNLQ